MPSKVAPMTVRIADDVAPLIEKAMDVTGWNKNHLINESLRKALPVLIDEKIARVAAMAKPPVDPVKAAAAAVRVARKPKP